MLSSEHRQLMEILREEGNSFLQIDAWETPATRYPLAGIGRAKITRTKQKRGFYYMEGVRGYDYYLCCNPVPVTSLKIGREVVMVDDPLQWYGMQDLASHCKGKVLIGGLGLGLILHALKENRDVTEIHVIEKEQNVIDLMRENIPSFPQEKLKIIHDDIEEYIDRMRLSNPYMERLMIENALPHRRADIEKSIETWKLPADYDTVVLDVWWGKQDRLKGRQMRLLNLKTSTSLPNAKVLIWGLRDPEINPAVKKVVNYEALSIFGET